MRTNLSDILQQAHDALVSCVTKYDKPTIDGAILACRDGMIEAAAANERIRKLTELSNQRLESLAAAYVQIATMKETLAAEREVSDKLEKVLAFVLSGMDRGYIECAPYFDFDPDAEVLEFKPPADMIRAALAEVAALRKGQA